ncbi:HD domain-containing protein [Sulfurimonas sp. SAG-AH-194-I05]|nr:HD domain-containing protein [Sulfurimonas sp. SAG-AH-194-I05]
MFEKHSCNLNPKDSILRITLATLFFIYAVYASLYILLVPSALLYYTGLSKFCFAYYFLKINDALSTKNYYLQFLPKYNPSSVFIFDNAGELVFKNKAAATALADVVSSQCLGVRNITELISSEKLDTLMLEHENKFYQIELQGIEKENILLAYLTDITEVIKLNDEIEDTQREIIYAMGEIGETRSKETGNHVKRVALYSKELALLYGLSQEEAEKLQMASPMHDIGKVGIPDAVLNAPRKLELDEWKIMQTHAILGYEMLKSSNKPILQAAAIVAGEHHEKWDGSGYPHAKSGEEIHIYGRITAVADVFDALGSERVYKKAWELDKILALFKEESGKHFDPKLIELFLDNLGSFLNIRDTFKDVA